MCRKLTWTLTSPPPTPPQPQTPDVTYPMCLFKKMYKTLARFSPRWHIHVARFLYRFIYCIPGFSGKWLTLSESIVLYTKITLLRVIPTMTFQNSLLTPLLPEAFVTGLLPNELSHCCKMLPVSSVFANSSKGTEVEMSLSTPVTLSSVQTDCFKLCHLQSEKWHCPGHSTTHARVCK